MRAAGMVSAFGATLNINLGGLNFSQQAVGYIGTAGTLLGNVLGISLGRAVDALPPGHGRKTLLVIANAVGAVAVVYFALRVTEVGLPSWLTTGSVGQWSIAVAATLVSAALNATAPLFFELAIEATHPTPEGTVITMLTNVYNFGGGVLLFVPLSNSPTAFNWVFAGTVVFFTFALAFGFDERSQRYDEDVAAERNAGVVGDVLDFSVLTDGRGLDAASVAVSPRPTVRFMAPRLE